MAFGIGRGNRRLKVPSRFPSTLGGMGRMYIDDAGNYDTAAQQRRPH